MSTPMNADLLGNMFASIGAGVWYTQWVEGLLQTYVAFKRDIQDRNTVTEAEAEGIIMKVRKSSLGTVLKFSEAATVLSNDLQNKVNSFNSERIWLIHYAAVEKGFKLYVDDQHRAFIDRVAQFTEEAKSLYQAISKEFEDFVVSKGVSREWVDRKAQEIFREMEGETA